MKTIAPAEAKHLMERHDTCVVLDVREPWEFHLARLDKAMNIPLRSLQQRMAELDPAVPYIVYCHHGSRSLLACALMTRAGFTDVHNLHGGIHQWSVAVDSTMKRY
jgi:sulfur-carrier protein adenylyltransferase/sulfurtransferase